MTEPMDRDTESMGGRMVTLSAGRNAHIPLPSGPLLIEVAQGHLLLFFLDRLGVRHIVDEASAGETLLRPTGGDRKADSGRWQLEPVGEVRARITSLDAASSSLSGSKESAAITKLMRAAGLSKTVRRPLSLGEAFAEIERTVEKRIQEKEAAGSARFAGVARTRDTLLGRSLKRLAAVAGVLDGQQEITAGRLPDDPDLAALTIAMRIEGAPLSDGEIARVAHILDETQSASGIEDRLERVMRLADIRYRRVELEDGWWMSNHGTLLIRTASDKVLVLEPKDGRGDARYRYWRVDEEAAFDLDPETAKALGDRAFQPCAPLPAQPLGLGDLLRYGIHQARTEAIGFAVLLAAAALLSLGTPLATEVVMSRAIPEGDQGLLLVLFTALLAAALAGGLFDLVRSLLMVRIEGRAAWRLQTALWDRLLRLPVSFFRDFEVGDLANRALSLNTIRAMAGAQVIEVISHFFFGLFALALMFWYSPLLATVAGGTGLLFGLLARTAARRVADHVRRLTDDTGALESMTFQFIQAITKIRVSGATNAAFARFADLYRGILNASRNQQLTQGALTALSGIWPTVIFAALVITVALASGELFATFRNATDWKAIAGESLRTTISPAGFIAFYTALGQFSLALVGTNRALLFLATVRPWAERITPILSTTPEAGSIGGGRQLADYTGHVRVHGLAFRYRPGTPRVLDGVDFEVRPGEMVALVGPSGAGKSTVVRLLLGFEKPEAGTVFHDGVDLSHLDPGWLRRHVGVVLQDGRLLPGSIFENIAAGSRITRKQAMEAIRAAGMEADLEQMPMGLETMLGEGAVTLSGGQRQRLMIARALVRRPRLVIFDEATSALDNETQSVVTDSLARLEVSRLVIAHRLSTIRDADRIHVLEAGRIVESGKFDELLALDGAFRRLARRQMIESPA